MSRVEHIGREWSESFLTGREKVQLFKWVKKGTGEQIRGTGSFVGRLLDVASNAEVAELECKWLENGLISVKFPAMEAGRYAISIDHIDQNGGVSQFLAGWAGYLSPAHVIEGISEYEEDVVSVCVSDDKTEVYALAGQISGYMAEEAIEAAKEAKEYKNEVLSVLELARAFMNSFNEALRRSIQVINNELWVAGYNTGVNLKGDPGVTPHIGLDGYWYAGTEKLSDRPAFGKDGTTPHITADGYWAFGDTVTSVKAAGLDGLNGDAIRFILVDSYNDIPQSGETCNGGYRYLVKKEAWALIGDASANDSGEWSGWKIPAYEMPSEFNRLKVPGALNQNSTPVYLLVRTEDGEVLGVSSNAKTWNVGDVVTWEFSEPVKVPNNCVVHMFLSKTNEASTGNLPVERIRMKSILNSNEGNCEVFYDGQPYGPRTPYLLAYGAGYAEQYDIYAWVENQGSAGWLKIDKTNQIANSRVYGLMKYATEMTVNGGAPVGQNADGQASVPIANPALPGAVLPSSTATESDGGRTHVGDDNKLYVDYSNPSIPGVGKTSYTQVVENTATVGMTSDGKYAVPPADTRQWGCCRIGTVVRQTNGEPFIIPMGRAADGLTEYPDGGGSDISGQLMMNTLYGGALRTTSKSTWRNWAPTGIDTATMPDNSNAVGIMAHPQQFSQSAIYGLELLPATSYTLAGVSLAESMEDTRDYAVLSPNVLGPYLKENYALKSDLSDEDPEQIIDKKLQNYATMTWCNGSFVSQSSLTEQLKDKVACPSKKFKNIEVLSKAELAALTNIDAQTFYLIHA